MSAPEPSAGRSPVRGRDTKALILDAAEALFSLRGYDGVSMREITAGAGVRLALATYHFATKENLFEAVIARRAAVLNERRLTALDALTRPTVADLLAAFIKPYADLRVSRDGGWRNYSLLIAQLAQLNRWLPLVHKYFNPVACRYHDALCAAMPGVPPALVARCFVFAIQLMVSELAGNERIDTLSQGTLSGQDVTAAYADLIPFLVGGFEAIARRARGRG